MAFEMRNYCAGGPHEKCLVCEAVRNLEAGDAKRAKMWIESRQPNEDGSDPTQAPEHRSPHRADHNAETKQALSPNGREVREHVTSHIRSFAALPKCSNCDGWGLFYAQLCGQCKGTGLAK